MLLLLLEHTKYKATDKSLNFNTKSQQILTISIKSNKIILELIHQVSVKDQEVMIEIMHK